MGPKQFGAISKILKSTGKATEGIKESTEAEEEDIPNLINKDFEEASKKQE